MSRNPRLRLACARCQRRKIRCDGQYPVCGNCTRASAECVDGDSTRLRPAPRERVSEREVPRLRRRIEWLESIIRDRLPDMDLAGETPPQETAGPRADQQEAPHDMVENALASINPLIPPDQRAHEIGLISIGANSDQKYIGPSSGYFLARLLLARSPQKNRDDIPELRLDTSGSQFMINELVDATKGSLPLPNRTLANRLRDVYFDTIHPQWPILHRPSFSAAFDQMSSQEGPNMATLQEDPHICFQVYIVLAISATVLSYRNKRQFSGESYCLSALQYLHQLNLQGSTQGLQCMLLLLVFTLHNPHMRLSIWHLNYQCLAVAVDLGLQRNVTARTGISLLDQEMRTRLFWVVYTFDRTISTIMGRPIGLRDEACELRLPQDINDETLTGAGSNPTPHSKISISIHLFKLAKLTSEFKYVANSIVHSVPAYAYPSITDIAAWQLDMLDRLDHWNADLPQHGRDNPYMKTLCEIRYHTMRMLLLRPSPAIPVPSQTSLTACHASARQVLRLYSRLNRQQLLIYDWLTLHGVVSSTITMLYCTRSVPDIARNTDIESFMGDMNISLSILSSMGEHWTGARRAHDVLEDLGTATLRWVRSLETREERVVDSLNDGNAGIDHAAVDGASLGGNGAVDSNAPDNLYIDPSIWSDEFDQTDLFGDNTDVDAFMRSLFDGFIPQADIFNASSQGS